MTVKPSRCLLWGLVLLTTAEMTTAAAAVSNTTAVASTRHVRTHTPPKPDEGHEFVEDRVLSPRPMVETVGNELRPFAGILVPKSTIDWLHMQKLADENMRKYDHLPITEAIDKLIEANTRIRSFFRDKALLIWLGTRSPEDQKLAINYLAATMDVNKRTKSNKLMMFHNGKKTEDLFHDLAAAVERKWMMNKSAKEIFKFIKHPIPRDNVPFVRIVGSWIWDKLAISEKEEFDTLMLNLMRGRSEDEIMWARLIYKLQEDNSVSFPLSGMFDHLLQSFDATAGDYKPTEAVKYLTSEEFLKGHNDMTLSSMEAGMVVRNALLQRSKDELMWAKLIFMLQDDQRASSFLSNVFDILVQPYDKAVFGPHQCTPSQAFWYLKELEPFPLYNSNLLTREDADAMQVTKLRTVSHDELMWGKLLYMLRHDKKVSTPLSGVLKSLVESWTVAEQPTFSESEAILTNTKFRILYKYAQFVSDNPTVFVLERLRERSVNDLEWAIALYKLRKGPNAFPPLAGVLDALLHSWVGRPYDAAAAAKSQHMLIDAFGLLMSRASEILHTGIPPTRKEANALMQQLLKWSNDELMWAKLLNKLQHDTTGLASSVFDALLQSYDATHAVHLYTPSQCVNHLMSLDVPTTIASSHDADASLLAQLLTLSSNEVMWAKVLYLLQNDESMSKPFLSRVLTILLQSWIRPVHGIAEELNTLDASERFLKSQGFVNLFVFARFSSDNPNVLLLEKLRERSADDLMWAQALNKLRTDQNVVTPLIGVLDALLYSWVGKPYDATAIADTQHILIKAYDYLASQELATWYNMAMIIDKDYANKNLLTKLLAISNDVTMWAYFLNKLQNDKSMRLPVNDVFKALCELWNVISPVAPM